jgi:hypothetical protein
MALPEILTKVIETVSQERKNHPDGEVMPYYRQQIYDAITSSMHQDLAFKVRGWLEIVTAEKVLPIWQTIWHEKETPEFLWKYWLDKEMPERLLKITKNILNNVGNIEEAEAQFERVWRDISEEPGLEGIDDKYQNPYNARQAAVQALNWVLGYTKICPKYTLEETDADLLDPQCGDAAAWASAAYGGDLWSYTERDWSKRQGFWDWWLKEAVPQAWELSQQS